MIITRSPDYRQDGGMTVFRRRVPRVLAYA